MECRIPESTHCTRRRHRRSTQQTQFSSTLTKDLIRSHGLKKAWLWRPEFSSNFYCPPPFYDIKHHSYPETVDFTDNRVWWDHIDKYLLPSPLLLLGPFTSLGLITLRIFTIHFRRAFFREGLWTVVDPLLSGSKLKTSTYRRSVFLDKNTGRKVHPS